VVKLHIILFGSEWLGLFLIASFPLQELALAFFFMQKMPRAQTIPASGLKDFPFLYSFIFKTTITLNSFYDIIAG
jgi:hypothetical protein